jgi:PiT family inorganic phosphate transporter
MLGPALIPSVYLGWSLGANDAANIFGTAVSTRMIRFLTAALLASLFVLVGALLEGYEGIHTYAGLSHQSVLTAGIVSLAAALTVTLMTLIKLPVSTSQAVVGAIIGVGLLRHDVNFGGLGKVVACWVGTPVGAFVIAVLLYQVLSMIFNRLRLTIFGHDRVLRIGLILAGCYGAYALGANNVANVTGPLAAAGLLTPRQAVLVGGVSIGLGILTFSRGVMGTVGKGIIRLDAFSALVVVVAEAITVHLYAIIGVPVSTSQAVIGAVLGIGVLKRIEATNFRAVRGIFTGWLATPLIAGLISAGTWFALHLEYTG